MTRFLKCALLMSAGLAAMSAGSALAAEAQSTDTPAATNQAANPTSVAEVVVTARRQSELAKDVPIAVTAYSAKQLDESGATDITDLEKTTPNTVLSVARGSNSTLTAYIRGIGQQDPLWGFEPGVGIYVDDIYIARPQLSVLDIFDVSSIEVLNGPQGTLYGRNTIGGAVKYVTSRIPDRTELDLKGNFGSYGMHDEIASVKTPLTDTLRASFTVASYQHDGYGTNIATGAQQYNQDVLAMRASLEFTPAQNLFFRISADQTDDRSNNKDGHRLLPYTSLTTGVTYNPLPNVYDTDSGAGDKGHVQTRGLSLLGQWDANDHVTVKSITAYRDGHTHGDIDFDETPEPILDVPEQYSDHQFTEELQGLWKGERLHAVGGVFYMNATAAGAFDTVLDQLVPLGPPQAYLPLTVLDEGYVITKSWSVYGNASYDLTKRLALELGGRWTDDDKTGHTYREYYIGLRSPVFGNAAAIPFQNRTNYTNEKTFTKFTPRASLTYKITPDLTTYVSYASGFKSGGFDMRGDAVLFPGTANGYAPETVNSYELGLKGSLFSHRLNFATDVFDGEYHNIQITTQYPTAGGIASVVDNAGSGYARGWEGQGSFRWSRDLTSSLTAGYVDADYSSWIGHVPAGSPGCSGPSLCSVNFAGSRHFAYVSRWTGSFSTTWSHDFGERGRVTLMPMLSYRSHYQIYETPTPLLDQDPYWLIDANLAWTSPNGRYEVSLHGKNLADTRYKVGGYDFSTATSGAGFGNSLDAFYGDPRTVFVTLAAKFY